MTETPMSEPADMTGRFERYAERLRNVDEKVDAIGERQTRDSLRARGERQEVLGMLQQLREADDEVRNSFESWRKVATWTLSIAGTLAIGILTGALWLVRTTYDADRRSVENQQALERLEPALHRLEVQAAESRSDVRALVRAIERDRRMAPSTGGQEGRTE